MRSTNLRFLAMLPVVAGLALAPSLLHAQTDYASTKLADSGKFLVITREMVKPGKDGAAHEKTEVQFAKALAAAKSTDYYEGMTSMSGPPRAMFLNAYSSLAEMEAKRKMTSAALGATLDKINEADGAVLSEEATSFFMRRDDLSTNVKAAPASARYMEWAYFQVKPGHEQEFEEAAKLYLNDMKKGVPAAHWTCYMSVYGDFEGPVYIFLTALTSLSEADKEFASDGDFAKAAGPGDLKKLSDGIASSVAVEESNLFRLDPKLSYPWPDLVASDPAFWKPKPTPAAKPAPATKPAQ